MLNRKINNSHLKSKSHKQFEKYTHIKLSLKNVDLKDLDETLNFYKNDHNQKFNHYLLNGQFILVFNDNQHCKFIMTGMIDSRTFISWSNCLRDAIDSLKTERYDFNYIAEIGIITFAQKRDMTYGFYLKLKMSAFEWKLNAMIDKDKKLINKFPQDWRHPLNRNIEVIVFNKRNFTIVVHVKKRLELKYKKSHLKSELHMNNEGTVINKYTIMNPKLCQTNDIIINNVNKYNRRFEYYVFVCKWKLMFDKDVSIDVKSKVMYTLSFQS